MKYNIKTVFAFRKYVTGVLALFIYVVNIYVFTDKICFITIMGFNFC